MFLWAMQRQSNKASMWALLIYHEWCYQHEIYYADFGQFAVKIFVRN